MIDDMVAKIKNVTLVPPSVVVVVMIRRNTTMATANHKERLVLSRDDAENQVNEWNDWKDEACNDRVPAPNNGAEFSIVLTGAWMRNCTLRPSFDIFLVFFALFSSCFNEMQMNIIGAPVPKVIFHENVAAAAAAVKLVTSAALIYIRIRCIPTPCRCMQMTCKCHDFFFRDF